MLLYKYLNKGVYMKKELIFIGPPACGKGTQTDRLANFLNLPHIDTGSLLREEIASGSENGLIAKARIDKGNLVPLEIVAAIIEGRLSQDSCKNGYVLDGYPRSMEQALKLDIINKNIDKDEAVDFKAIYFEIDKEILLERIVHRQSCPNCGTIYNKKYNPPKTENYCDKCNTELKTRNDDTREVAIARFKTYQEQTAPLIDFYKNKGLLFNLNANGTIEEVWERLLALVNN